VAGFGRSKFGKGPFGKSDVGGDLVVDLFPEKYVLDAAPEGTDPNDDKTNPLLQVLKTYANAVSKRREDVDAMPTLIDYEKAPDAILLLLGDMLGLGIDKNDPEFLKRSFVGNASQWLQIKGTQKGYEVRGLASGFAVEVDRFWRIDAQYEPLIPLFHQFPLRSVNADPGVPKILHVDVPPGTFPGTPLVEDETYAKSSFIRLVFTIPPNSPLIGAITGTGPVDQGCVDFNIFLDLVIDKIKDVTAINHEVIAPEFLTIFNIDNTIVGQMSGTEIQSNVLVEEACYFDISGMEEDVEPLDGCLRASMS